MCKKKLKLIFSQAFLSAYGIEVQWCPHKAVSTLEPWIIDTFIDAVVLMSSNTSLIECSTILFAISTQSNCRRVTSQWLQKTAYLTSR